LTPQQAQEWEQYAEQEPFGDECLYLAVIATWLFNGFLKGGETPDITEREVMDYVESLKDNLDKQPQEQSQISSSLRSWGLSMLAPLD